MFEMKRVWDKEAGCYTHIPIDHGSNEMEVDPDGKAPHEAGSKLDAGKNRLALTLGSFAKALWEVGEVGTYGANKYSDNGWKEVDNAKARYLDAGMRHLLKHFMGEEVDEDSDQLHLAQACWNFLAALEFELEEGE